MAAIERQAMSREDVALLVFRTLGLWVGAVGAVGIVTLVAQPAPGTEVGGWAFLAGIVPLAIGAGLWVASPPLARAVFGRGSETVSFGLTAAGIPPLACFVVGVLQIAAAIPAAAGWVALRVMRSQEGGLMSPAIDPGRLLDEQGAVSGASLVARLAVGAALIVLSRRRDIWTTGTDVQAE
jgi:hypothetical protein